MQPASLVFLPGFLCDARLFAPQAKAAAALGWTVSYGDLTGHGTIEGLAIDVLAAAPARFALAGLSMGGILALEIARQAPARLTHLVVMNATARADQKATLREVMAARVACGDLAGLARDDLAAGYFSALAGDPRAADLVVDMALSLGPTVFERQNAALATRPDQRSQLGSIVCPTLVIAGADDPVCPPFLSEEIAAAIPGAQLDVIARCGHLSTLDQPDAVTTRLMAFLGEGAAGHTVKAMASAEFGHTHA